jgi:hypothetical protein
VVSLNQSALDCLPDCSPEEIQGTISVIDQITDLILGLLYTFVSAVTSIWDLFQTL